ncbi:MAG: DUF1573 domain-containing protein [Gemmatales bacterium]
MTAALKMHGIVTDPYGQDNFLALPWLQILTIEIEVILGLWLLSGFASNIAWFTTLAFFILLAGFSFTLASQGQSSCGCFGKVEVNPWYTFALDVGIVIVMLVTSFASRAASAPGVSSQNLRPLFQIALLTTVFLGAIALGFTLFTPDPMGTLARLRGETLAVHPPITQLGEGTAGEQRTFQIALRNYSDKPIKVVGGTTTCSCIATQDLPITIPPGSSETINVKIKFSGSAGKFAHRFMLYTDADKPLTVARFSGSVMPPTTPATANREGSTIQATTPVGFVSHGEGHKLAGN